MKRWRRRQTLLLSGEPCCQNQPPLLLLLLRLQGLQPLSLHNSQTTAHYLTFGMSSSACRAQVKIRSPPTARQWETAAGSECIQHHIHHQAEMAHAGYNDGALSDMRLGGNFEDGREAAGGETLPLQFMMP